MSIVEHIRSVAEDQGLPFRYGTDEELNHYCENTPVPAVFMSLLQTGREVVVGTERFIEHDVVLTFIDKTSFDLESIENEHIVERMRVTAQTFRDALKNESELEVGDAQFRDVYLRYASVYTGTSVSMMVRSSIGTCCKPKPSRYERLLEKYVQIKERLPIRGITSLSFKDSTEEFIDISNIDTSQVTSFNEMFAYSKAKKVDLRGVISEQVTNMGSLFRRDYELEEIVGLDELDTRNVTDMNGFFMHVYGIKSLTLSPRFDTSNVTNMRWMFNLCTNLEHLDLGKNFDTSKVTDMGFIFSGLPNLLSLDLGDKFDTSSVVIANSLFRKSAMYHLYLGDKFDTSKVTTLEYCFSSMPNLRLLDLGDKFDTSKVTNMDGFIRETPNIEYLDLGDKFDTSNVTNIATMFLGCTNLKTINFGSKFNVSKAESLYGIFYDCENLENILGTISGIKFNILFKDCPKLTRASMLVVFNGLEDVVNRRTVTFHPDAKARLLPEDIAIATAKGWTIA